MATAKSDDESDVASHPLAENRPGVYVQVVAPRRRKKNKRGESASSSRPPAGNARGGVREETDARVRARRKSDPRVADSEETALASSPSSSVPHLSAPAEVTVADLCGPPSEAPTVVGRFDVPAMFGAHADARTSLDSEPATEPGPSTAGALAEEQEDDGRQSGERPVDFDSMRAREAAFESGAEPRPSTKANQRPDLSGMSIPPPPRLPSFARGEEPSERISATPAPMHSASLLDAPPTLRPAAPDSTPAARSSATLLAFVAAFTAIIVTAGLVALRELAKPDQPAAQQTRAVIGAPAQPAPVAVPTQPAPAAEPAPVSAEANVAPAAVIQPVTPAAPTSAVAARAPIANARAKKAAPGRALVAKANAALRQLSDTGLKATPQGEAEPEPAAEEQEERAPNPGEPLELPVNPY